MNNVCLVWDWKGALTYHIMLLKPHFPYLGGYWFCVFFSGLSFFRLDVVLWEKKLFFPGDVQSAVSLCHLFSPCTSV